MNRLLKKEIKVVPARVLNMRYCRILEQAEKTEAKDIPVADAREILWIEDELHRRLVKLIGHDFYPPDRIEKRHPSNYMIFLVKQKEDEVEEKAESTFSFTITITSSVGSIVARQTVKVDSRSDAEIEAGKIIKKLGLKKATYKIS